MGARLDFIFMLTHRDRTVADCLEVLDEIAPLRLRHIGFKDIGADPSTLRVLNQRIRESGARSYLEIVATSPPAALAAARLAVELKVDCVLGGRDVETILAVLRGTGIEYYPFAGRPFGHPTKLDGDASEIREDCAAFAGMGCAGVDLLAFRATEADPLDLVRAARLGLGARKKLICAGNVDGPARIAALRDAGCDSFTVGSAVFERSFAPDKQGLLGQLRAVLDSVRTQLP
jgi:hypothetical protein